MGGRIQRTPILAQILELDSTRPQQPRSMHLTLRFFAALRERAGTDELSLSDLPQPLDVAGLKAVLHERNPELGDLGHVRGVVGDRYVPDDTPLEEGDVVALLPPVSGGSGAALDPYDRGVFEVSAAALDAGGAWRRVAHPACGAVCVFTGTTRERNRGEDVVRLDYEAFEELAAAEMGRIFEECRARFVPDGGESAAEPAERCLRMLCLHRTGSVAIGEPSVVVAVASPHRDTAFAACRHLIDELKARVPLWKKEIYADGHHWINDRS